MFFKGELSPAACPALLSAMRAALGVCTRPNMILLVVENTHTYITNNVSEREFDPPSDKTELICRFNNIHLWRVESFDLVEPPLALILNPRALMKRLAAAGGASQIRLKVDPSLSSTEHYLHCEVVGQSFNGYPVELILPPQHVPTYRIPQIEPAAIQLEMRALDVKAGVLGIAAAVPDTRTNVSFEIADPENVALLQTAPNRPVAGLLTLHSTRSFLPTQFSTLKCTTQSVCVTPQAVGSKLDPKGGCKWSTIVPTKDLHNAMKTLSERMQSTTAFMVDNSHIILTGPTNFGVCPVSSIRTLPPLLAERGDGGLDPGPHIFLSAPP